MKTDMLKAAQGVCLAGAGYAFYPVADCISSGNVSRAAWMAVPLAIILLVLHVVTAKLRARADG